jgi:hypothetical protein
MAFSSAISAIDNLKQFGLSLIFDDRGTAPTARYSALYDRYQDMFKTRGEPPLKGLAFRSMIDTIPLQGADMIAWETYCHMVDRLDDWSAKPRPHLQRYIDSGRFFAVLLRRDSILEYLRRIRPAPAVSLGWWKMPWPLF